MAYINGTATNHLTLLATLRDFLTSNTDLVAAGQEWTVVGGVSTGAIAHDQFVSLRAPGLSGDDQIYMTIKTHTNSPAGIYSLQIRGHTAYGTPSDTPGGLNSPWCYLPLVNSSIRYWIVANGRRFILIAKANNRYDVMYGGFMLPEHLPTDWTYPLLVGASAIDLMQASVTGPQHANFWSSYASGYLFTPSQIWRALRNFLYPSGDTDGTVNDGLVSVDWNTALSFPRKARCIDNSAWISASRVAEIGVDDLNPRNYLGAYDGVFFIPAVGATIEGIVVYDSKNYLVVSNVYRNNDGNLAAICLE